MRRPQPWFVTMEAVLRPALVAWFNWNFEGEENIPREGPLLVAANHISHFDPLADALMLVRNGRRPRYLAKSDLWHNKLLGTVLTGAGQIPVERGSGSSAPLENAMRALKDGECVVVYPEATTTRNPDHLPMQGKTGVARLALSSGIPVLPMAVWGTQHMFQRDESTKGLTFGRPIWVKAGVGMDLSDFTGREDDPTALREATDRVMAEITILATELRDRYPKRWE